MWKIIKMVIGLCALSGLGLLYGNIMDTVDDLKEEWIYSYISLGVPNTESSMIFIKKVPESKCEKWRKEYFDASMQNCKGCNVLSNVCTENIPKDYLNAFDKQKISTSYVYKPYKYPEIAIMIGLQEGGFSQYCDLEKTLFADTMCIE